MKRLLYLSHNEINFRELKTILQDIYDLDFTRKVPSEINSQYHTVIYEWQENLSGNLENIFRLTTTLELRDVPLFLSVSQSELAQVKQVKTFGVTGIAVRPFTDEQRQTNLIEMLQKAPDSHDLFSELQQYFVVATLEVLGKTAGTDVKLRSICTDPKKHTPGELSACLDITGCPSSHIRISLSHSLAVNLAARIVGCSEDDISDNDVLDGVGEITNQISGWFRCALAEFGYNQKISLPTVRKGPDNQCSFTCNMPSQTIIFQCLDSTLSLQFWLKTPELKASSV